LFITFARGEKINMTNIARIMMIDTAVESE
jgi:hypothetical protein